MSKISVKSFISSIIVILLLMIVAYILTLVVPGGVYPRILDSNRNYIIDPQGSFSFVEGGIPFYKWVLSPILLLFSESGSTIILILVFLLIIGGVSNVFDKQGLIKYMVDKLSYKYGKKKYLLISLLILIFMLMGSIAGTFEEIVPMVPIVCSIMIALGFDYFTGIATSLLAVAAGFSSGILNPFTVGVAQQLAGVAMFSGMWLRVVGFVFIYALLLLYTISYAKKIERKVDAENNTFTSNKNYDNALLSFAIVVGIGLLLIVLSVFIETLQDYTMVVVAFMFLFASIASSVVLKTNIKEYFKFFLNGLVSILPAMIMILMASSIKYTLEEAKVLDTIMYYAINACNNLPNYIVILMIYLIVLVMNFFISSGSAKAFLLIPLIVPIANLFGISANLCILAFAFGDGFSNAFYPTNPVLLISLGITNTSYSNYVKFSWKYHLLNLILTSFILLFGLLVSY